MKSAILLAVTAIFIFCGCKSVNNVKRADVSNEGTIVFTRAARYTPFFGTFSPYELLEIVYEQSSRNASGQLVVEVGIRYRGSVSWTNWHVSAPDQITLRTLCNFYQGSRSHSAPVYSTNHRNIVIRRGETYNYKAVCPVENTTQYQLVLGD